MALGTTNLAINVYQLAPGERLPGGLHAHMDQEEIFLILEGTATFETTTDTVTLSANEIVRFAPGEFHAGLNAAATELRILALGAPPESTDIRLPLACPECDHTSMQVISNADKSEFVCPACQTVRVPTSCPQCTGTDLRVVLNADRQTVVSCMDCHHEFETPPVENDW